MKEELQQQVTFTIEAIEQAMAGPLPGITGQIKMAPQPPSTNISRWNPPEHCREAGVLLLLYPHVTPQHTAELHLALTRRRRKCSQTRPFKGPPSRGVIAAQI